MKAIITPPLDESKLTLKDVQRPLIKLMPMLKLNEKNRVAYCKN